MTKKISLTMKYMAIFSLFFIFAGLIEILAGLGTEYTNKSFLEHFAGVFRLNGSDTIMTGIWVIISVPALSIVIVLVDSFRQKNFRLASLCLFILGLLAALMITGN